MSVGFHHGSAVLVGGLIAAFALLSPKPLRTAVLLGAAATVALLPLAAFNTWLFGSRLRTGYSAATAFYDSAVEENSGGIFRIDVGALAGHVWRYWLRPEILLVLAAALLGARVLRRRSTPAGVLVLALLLGAVPYLVFMGARPLFGSGRFALNASFLRYGLPVFVVVAVLASATTLATGERARRLALTGAAVVAIVAAATIVTSDLGPRELADEYEYSGEQNDLVLEATPEDALIITAKHDKFLWPERATLTAPFLVQRQDPGGEYLYDLVPSPERLADVVTRLVGQGETVFLWDPGAWFASDPTRVPELDFRLAGAGILRAQEAVPGLSSFSSPAAPA